MRIEYMLSREAYPAPLIRVEVAGLEKSELPNISGAISINGQEEVDISLTLIANDVVRIQGQRIDLAVSAHGNALKSPSASVFHLLVGISFAPGLIGVDWEDVCSLLAAGSKGALTSIAIGQDVIFEPLIRDLVEPLQGEVRAIIACLYLPEAKFFSSSVGVVNELIKGFEGITGEFVLGVPIVITDMPILSLMLITD